MANILYRGASVPTAANNAGANNAPLTNDQIDKNLYALNAGKVETSDYRLTDARPASDVYTWAKAATKPSYTYSEIGSTPTAYSLPTASITVLGGIKVGTNLSIDGSGVLSSSYVNTTYSASTGLTLTGTAFSVNYGDTATTACVGNDSRLTNARAASDVYDWAKAATKPSYAYSEIGSTPTIPTSLPHNGTALTATTGTFSGNVSVTGAISATGNITSTSDARVKANVQRITSPLAKVNQLNGYTFDRTDIETPRQTGVIAQEVLLVLPEAVSGNEDGYSVAYGNMIGLMIEAIKELNMKIQDLQNQLANK